MILQIFEVFLNIFSVFSHRAYYFNPAKLFLFLFSGTSCGLSCEHTKQIWKEHVFCFGEAQCFINISPTIFFSTFSKNTIPAVIALYLVSFLKKVSRFYSESYRRSIKKQFCLARVYLNFTAETKQLFILRLSFERWNLFFY